MKRMLAAWIVGVGLLASSGSLAAHHSLVQFDLSVPVRIKGTVVRLERLNPHSLLFIYQLKEDGQTQQWAVDGPTPMALSRRGVDAHFLKTGDVIEVCGFPLKDGVASPRGLEKVQARVMSGHLLVMPDGKKWMWNDYGQFDRCLAPGETRADIFGTNK